MRYSSIYLLFANSFAPTFAELTCLQWAFISPLVSAMCCFTPSTAGKVEDTAKTVGTATIAGVKSAVDDVKDLVQFELTHNVVSVAYNFGNIAHNSGWSSAQEYLKNTTQDDAEVALGFAKESIQQAYTIMNLQNWNDFAYCAIKDATKQAISASNKRRGLKKRKISDVDAAGIFKGCLNEKFAKGPHFNTSTGYQHVGATISDIAALLIPIGPEAEVAVAGAEASVDLGIIGLEDTTRIYKQGEAGLARAEHFANPEEAQKVAKSLKEEGWQAKNCGVCGLEGSAQASAGFRAVGSAIGSARRALQSRGNVFGMCCNPAAAMTLDDFEDWVSAETISVADSTGTIYGDNVQIASAHGGWGRMDVEFDAETGLEIFDPKNYRIVAESELATPADYTVRNIFAEESEAAERGLRVDVQTTSTGVVPFSADLKAQMSSKDVFKKLRDMFTGSPDDPLYKAMRIRKRDDLGRIMSLSAQWGKEGAVIPDVLKPMYDWVEVLKKDAAKVLRKLDPHYESVSLDAAVEFFWTPPGEQALIGLDPRGLHLDGGLLSMGTADTAGLVIKDAQTELASRVKLVDDGFHLLKGEMYGRYDPEVTGWQATFHGVWGPEMAEHGRTSIIVGVFEK